MLEPSLLLPRLTAKSVWDKGKQYFVTAQGDRIPSVTTILNATKSQEDRDALSRWKQRVGVAQASQITKAASSRGTQTHKYIQRYLQGEDKSIPDSILPYWQSIEPVLRDIHDIRLVEGSVFHQDLRYAGRVDCVASYRGVSCICEWKTADKPKGSVDRLHDYPLQLTAYLGAVNQSYQDYDIRLDSALLVVAIPGIPAEMFWFEPEQMTNYWQEWEQRVVAYWRR